MNRAMRNDHADEREPPSWAPLGASRMRALAQTYPELRAFTPDATLNEVKIRFGLGSLEQVRQLARRRLASG